MKRTLAVATASSLLLLSTSVLADNLSGFYVGADATFAESYDFDSKTLKDTTDNAAGDREGLSASDTFGSFDVKVGYNFDLASDLFLGLEANYNLSAMEEVFQKTATETNSFSKEDSYGVRAKIGSLVSEDAALYGIVGYQVTDFELTTDDGTTNTFKNDHSGIVYGVGATYAFAPNLLLSGEAVRIDYDSSNYIDDFFDIEPSGTKFSVGLAYRFDI